MDSIYNDLLDSDVYHVDDVTVIGDPSPIPQGVNRDGIPFGGHQSTALNAVNYVTVDRESAARRNIEDLKARIALRLEREKSNDLTAVV